MPNATDYSPSWDTTPPAPRDAFEQENDYWDTMVAVKRISSGNVQHVVKRTAWQSGTTYDMYRHDVSRTKTSKPSELLICILQIILLLMMILKFTFV